MIMLIAPEKIIAGKAGMDLLQSAMQYHLGRFGVIFIALTLFLFSFSTFLEYCFMPEAMWHIYLEINGFGRPFIKIVALIMLFIGGIATYTFSYGI